MAITAAVRPSSSTTPNGSWTLAGASAHAALADDSDATYLRADSSLANDVGLYFPTPSVPAGGHPTALLVVFRVKKAAGVNRYAAGTIGSAGFAAAGYPESWYQNLVTWVTPTTGIAVVASADPSIALDVSSPRVLLSGVVSRLTTFYEVTLFGVYVAKPVATATGPTGTLTTDNRPAITWTRTLDSLGGSQARFQVRLYDATTHGAFGSVNPDSTSPYLDSGSTADAGTSWSLPVGLPDDNYRAYVRVAQDVGGTLVWSDWSPVNFTIDVALPAVPTLTLTAESVKGRIEVELAANSGAATTDLFEVEVSDNGTDWSDAKTLEGAGRVTNSGGATIYDYFAGNGATRYVRARAVKNHGAGLTVVSAWTATATEDWSSSVWWLKHPTTPALNMIVRPFSLPGYSRPAREGRFQGLGSAEVIVVSDFAGPAQGQITLDLEGLDEQAELEALLEPATPLLLQAPAGTHWRDRWLALSNLNRRPIVDKLKALDAQDQLDWIEVSEPTGNITAWPA